MSDSTPLDPTLVMRLDRAGPRYTSYPTADRFASDFTEADYRAALPTRTATQPLSVYVHLPHCQRICTYCACNMIGSKSAAKREAYVDVLLAELALVASATDLTHDTPLGQLHFGGGTPNSYTNEDLERLVTAITTRFPPTSDAELAIEVDPRLASQAQLDALRQMGMNRVSFGVQDNDPEVQAAIGRFQTEAETRAALTFARAAAFPSVNIDLVYGLPKQTLAGFDRTLDLVIDAAPDRIALFSFAFLPDLKPNQRKIDPAALAPAERKVAMLIRARERFAQAGYLAIGMDHFARPSDPMGAAAQDPAHTRLRRNFQGYTIAPAALGAARLDVLGLGLSAVSDLAGVYAQNEKDHDRYTAAVLAGRLPIERGLRLRPDDVTRRALIEAIMTQGRIERTELAPDAAAIVTAAAASALTPLIADGLLTVTEAELALTPLGALFPRLIAMTFDAHLGAPRPEHDSRRRLPTFSRVI